MRIIDALKNKRARNWGLVGTIGVAIVLPLLQTGFFQNSFESWFLTLVKSPLNSLLFVVFSLLFGSMISLQVYSLSKPKLCKDCDTKAGKRTGVAGVIFGSLVGICPACIGLVGLIFPLGTSLALTRYGWALMLVAIGIMTLSIYLIGGFKRD